MRFTLRSFTATATATAFLACTFNLAQAAALTLETGKTTVTDQWSFSQFNGSLVWRFDPKILAAHPELGWATGVSIVEPASPLAYATIAEEPGGPLFPLQFSVSMPLTTLHGELQGQAASVQNVQSAGGLVFSPYRPGVVSDMPFTYLSNLRVDWSSQGVYADLSYTMGERHDVRLMSFTSSEGMTGLRLSGGYAYQSEHLLGLRLTPEGYEALFHHGLDLPAFEDMGSMGSMYVSAFAQITAVPEPSRTMLTMLGLGLVGLSARRRKQW